MMEPHEINDFIKSFALAHEIMPNGRVFSIEAGQAIFNILSPYPLEIVKKAINHHIATAQFAPQPSDIVALLNTGNKHLSPAEAWAIVPKSEFESGVITDEMLRAWCIVSDLYEAKKHYAAEKAFLSAYARIVTESELLKKPIAWKLTKGSNLAHLQDTIEQAVRLGRLSSEYANNELKTLPALDRENVIKRLGNDGFIAENSVIEHLKVGCNKMPVTEKNKKNAARARELIAMQEAQINAEKEESKNKIKSLESKQQSIINSALNYLAENASPKELKRILKDSMTSDFIPNGLVAD